MEISNHLANVDASYFVYYNKTDKVIFK